jgi:Tol biopolymer transport system component
VVTPDGRFVLFASTAANIALATNGSPLSSRLIPVFNVFLRDRAHGTTTLVSANLSGDGGNGDSFPSCISSNGQFAVFESAASDLVSGDTNNASDVFIRDFAGGTTTLISVNTNGLASNGGSHNASVTPDGRYVAFVSAASDLVWGDTNGISDVFVRDTVAGTTTLGSTGAVARPNNTYGNWPGYDNRSGAPEITPDGRYVAFLSTATNLVQGVRLGADIYIRDLLGGTTVWASTGASAALHIPPTQTIYAASYNHRISADGQFVAYETSIMPGISTLFRVPSFWSGCVLRYNLTNGLTDIVHTNAFVSTAAYEDISSLDMTPDGRFVVFVANTNGVSGFTTCVLLWDAQSGTTTLVSGDTNNLVQSNSVCDFPTIDPSGRYIAFLSSATNLVTNVLSGEYHLYLRDMLSGTTTVLDAGTTGSGSGITGTTIPLLNSLITAFEAADGNLIRNDRNHRSDLFVRDNLLGSVDMVSVHDPTLTSSTPNGPSLSTPGGMSGDGRFVVFASDADNFAANDTNGCREVFIADLAAGTNALVSISTNGFSGDGPSAQPVISADGRYVAFTSGADNLVPGDTNRLRDVFLRDLVLKTTVLVSVNSSGNGSGNNDSFSPSISSDGRFILYHSRTNIVSSFALTENLYLRDMQLATNYALTTEGQHRYDDSGRAFCCVRQPGGLVELNQQYLRVGRDDCGAGLYEYGRQSGLDGN